MLKCYCISLFIIRLIYPGSISLGNIAKKAVFWWGSVAVDCIALNYLGKHKRKMVIRALAGK